MADEMSIAEVLRLNEFEFVEIAWTISNGSLKVERGHIALPYKHLQTVAGQDQIIHLNKDIAAKDFDVIPVNAIARIVHAGDQAILWQRPC